jgi:ABC-type branched-subunit amino acid transport system substrate-binding protein
VATDTRGDMPVRTTWLRCISALAVMAFVAGACSSNRSDEPTATGGGDESGGSQTTAANNGGATKFGDLDSPCGKGDATGATDQGVTNRQIVIGYGDDKGFPTSPGLSHETSDAMKAMIKWCNDQGGINGRKLVGKYYDAAITDVVNAMTQACTQVFMLVGEAWALDSAQEETRLGCGLPAVPTYSVSPEFANAPLVYQSNPNPADIFAAGAAGELAKLFPDKVKKASVMYGNFSATIDTKDKVVQAFPKFGWKFLNCPQEYNIAGEPDWKPFAQKLKDCGAEVVYYSGQPYPNMQNLLDDAAQIDYRPIWLVDVNAYLKSFADWNSTGNGDNVYLRTSFTPFEQADDNPATKQYMDIVQGKGGDISQLAEQTTSSFLLWATAAKECGADLTRDCVLEKLSQIKSWTGGGLHTKTDPGDNLPTECSMLLKLDGTSWVQAYPDKTGEFECDPGNSVKLRGRVVDQAELNADRISTKYQTKK